MSERGSCTACSAFENRSPSRVYGVCLAHEKLVSADWSCEYWQPECESWREEVAELLRAIVWILSGAAAGVTQPGPRKFLLALGLLASGAIGAVLSAF
jgi:hypothetical protein